MTATTRAPSSTTSGTRTFSTRSGTPKWRPTASKTFGETDNGESRIALRIPRHVHEITRSRAMASCAASACAPSARPRCQPPSSAGSACALWALAWPPAQPQGMACWEPEARQAPRAFNDFRRLTGSRREHGLDELDGLLDLLVRHLLYAVRVLYLHLARHQQRKYFDVRGRLIARDLFNCLLAVLAEMQQQRLHELLIEQVTRAVPVAVRVACTQDFSDVAALPDGGFIVAWADAATALERVQRFDEAGNLVGTPFTLTDLTGLGFPDLHTNAATYSDGRAIVTLNVPSTGLDVETWILDTRITDANQTTGENFFGAGGGPADLFLIRDFNPGLGTGAVRQLEAVQTNGSATVFGTVGTNQHFVGSGDFNGDGLSDLLINVDNPATGTRAFLVDQMNPGGIQSQSQIAVRGADWIVDATDDFNHNGTDDILVHRDVGGQRTLEVMVMNNNVVTANTTIGVNGVTWDVDGTGDFNHDGTPDILQHQINLNAGSMTLRDLVMSPNAVQVQSAPTLGTIGSTWQVDGTGDFNGDGTADILIHQDSSSTGARTFHVLTIQNNAVVSGTTIAVTGTNISVGGIGDFNHDGTSDFLVHQDGSTTRTDIVYNVVNNTVVSAQTIAVTGIDCHVS